MAANWPSVDGKNKRLFRHLPVQNENVKIKNNRGKRKNSQKYKSINNKDLAECDSYCSLVHRYNFSIISTVRFSKSRTVECCVLKFSFDISSQYASRPINVSNAHTHSPHTQCDTHVIIVSANHFLRNNRAGTKHQGSYLQV